MPPTGAYKKLKSFFKINVQHNKQTDPLNKMSYINTAFRLVMELSRQYNIDESHALKHSMEVYGYAKKIMKTKMDANPWLAEQESVIYLAAILHDMCDHKYTMATDGVVIMNQRFADEPAFEMVIQIITTMSYSTVKKNGYPDLGTYQMAYHIVREADLLAAYDIDRCIMYSMYMRDVDYEEALRIAVELFDVRVFKYRSDGLFLSEFAKWESAILHANAVKKIAVLLA